jgi:heme/copper-type cytochrome/quinol oxidase subunit 1
MNYIISKPHVLLFITGAILLLISFLFRGQTIDIHLHDTYFVIGKQLFYIGLAIILALMGGLYVLCAPALTFRLLTWIHVSITIIAIIALINLDFLQPVPEKQPGETGWTNFSQFVIYNRWISAVAMLLFLAQFVFLINLIIGVVKTLSGYRPDRV